MGDEKNLQDRDRLVTGLASLGPLLAEGKTKRIYGLHDDPELALCVSKDRLTAFGGAKSHVLEGKAHLANMTTCKIFDFLNQLGLDTHFVRQQGDCGMVIRRCDMIPIEWVTRRIATGSFLQRNPSVKEGYVFRPVKLESFYKDDAQNDPQWSFEEVGAGDVKVGGRVITPELVDRMLLMTETVFEVLERAWASLDCQLVDMKVEFGFDQKTGKLLLADVIDNDSWRLWPKGDSRLMKDKQVYRDAVFITPEKLKEVLNNYEWVSNKLDGFIRCPVFARVVVFSGSPMDNDHVRKIIEQCKKFGIEDCISRISSAHKATRRTLEILATYEAEANTIPTVVIAVAGKSNGLGPVLAGNTVLPVINCPPLSGESEAKDVWSSLRLPSDMGCPTALDPGNAALACARVIAMKNPVVWGKIKARQCQMQLGLMDADQK